MEKISKELFLELLEMHKGPVMVTHAYILPGMIKETHKPQSVWENEINRAPTECMNILYEITHPVKKPCISCKYFKQCGNTNRTEPCKGRETKGGKRHENSNKR